ncbi:putative E3 ubiquitin-protein ligase XBAT35 [Vigna umbellata]|uniref:putative E3 ubiquitin-protein ligase XBAT35 n=1 Tax=Vigna umbellata TaxID=87088 RepID=UPI001F5F93A9|nr:putative E3 ubiquitin-protein ligase XBAT35 [Vigna umbellata]
MTCFLIECCIILPIFQASPVFLQNNAPTGPPTAPPAAEDTELAMAINASLQSAIQERPSFPHTQPNSDASSSSTAVNTGNHGFLGTPNSNTSENELVQETKTGGNGDHHQSHVNASELDFNPSAPPIVGDIPTDGPIQYPSIDLSPVDMASSDVEKLPNGEGKTASGSGSSCVICLDAPAEGACIPCGHVAGCMSCLNEVKSKKWGCPVCRGKIDQIIKLYHV